MWIFCLRGVCVFVCTCGLWFKVTFLSMSFALESLRNTAICYVASSTFGINCWICFNVIKLPFTPHAEIHGKIHPAFYCLKKESFSKLATLGVFVPDHAPSFFWLSLFYEKAECLDKTREFLMLQFKFSFYFSTYRFFID